jgi:peptide/nickel transport system substrate-binding protein
MVRRVVCSLILVTILVGTSILAACTPSPAPSSTPASSTTAAPSASPTLAGVVRGGILRTANNSDPTTLNPLASTNTATLMFTSPVFSGLVRTNPQKAAVNPDNILPDLAEKWDIINDAKTYTFHLRQGIKWHDGQAFTAGDVKYSLDMYRDPKVSPSANNVAAIDNVEIADNYTVKVNLKYPYPDFLVMIVSPYFAILPEHLKNVDPKNPDFLVGTGPFKFKSRAVGKVYTYERNPDYFVKGLPYLNGVEIYILATTAMAEQFIGGRLDTAGNLRQYLENWESIQKVKQMAPEASVVNAEDGAIRAVQFNFQRKGAWQELKVRQAMQLLIDYPALTTACAGSLQVGHIAPVGLMPSYIKGAIPQKDLMAALGIDKSIDERTAKAKQLMKDAGYADGFSAEIVVNDTPTTRDAAIYLADIWKRALNVNLKVTPLLAAQLFPRQSGGDFDMTINTIAGSGHSPVEYLGNFVTGAPVNSGKWSNKDYDQLFPQIVRETDLTKRADEILKAQQIFLSEMPYIALHSMALGTAVRPDMRIGWPAVNGPVPQPGNTTLTEIDNIWFAGTPDAKRWSDVAK